MTSIHLFFRRDHSCVGGEGRQNGSIERSQARAEEQPRAKSGRGEQTGGAPLALKLTRVLSQDSRVGWWPQGASAQLTKQCQWLSLHLSPLVVAMLQQTGVLQPPAFSPHLCLEQLLGNSCLPPGLCRDTLLFLIHFSQPAGKF